MSNFVPNVIILRIHVHVSKLWFHFSHYILYHIISTHTPFRENRVDNNTTTRVAIVLKTRIVPVRIKFHVVRIGVWSCILLTIKFLWRAVSRQMQ